MDDAGNVPQYRQQDVQPEMKADAHLEKNAQWRKEDRENESNNIHGVLHIVAGWTRTTDETGLVLGNRLH
jgi:hypothetical protein